MALNDINLLYGDQTSYVWGGWDEDGYSRTMKLVDMATGATSIIQIGQVQYQTQGFVTNENWSWTPGRLLYLTSGGGMTQTRPTSGYVTIVGIAFSETQICLDPRPPFEYTEPPITTTEGLTTTTAEGFTTTTEEITTTTANPK